jgi:hypothetical protein
MRNELYVKPAAGFSRSDPCTQCEEKMRTSSLLDYAYPPVWISLMCRIDDEQDRTNFMEATSMRF